jgi:hypothetical protein
MKSRVAEGFYDVWVKRCRELCRGVEFGGATGLFNANWIRFARPKEVPDRILGIFHIRIIGRHEVELVLDDHYNPARHVTTLGRGYRTLAEKSDYEGSLIWLPPDLFR